MSRRHELWTAEIFRRDDTLSRRFGPLLIVGLVLGMYLFALRTRSHWDFMRFVMFFAFAVLVISAAIHKATLLAGADGIAIRQLLRRELFVSYRDLESVTCKSCFVSLELRAGRSFRLGTSIGRATPANVALAKSVALEIERRRQRFPSAVTRVDELRRGERSLDRWLSDLRHLGGLESYRRAHVARDALWAVLESASSPAVDRIAAAVVLNTQASSEDRARVGAVARTCACTQTRERLELVARAAEPTTNALVALTDR